MGAGAQVDPYAQIATPDPYAQIAQPAQQAATPPAVVAPPPVAAAPAAPKPTIWQEIGKSINDNVLNNPIANIYKGLGHGALQTIGGIFTGGDHSGAEPADVLDYMHTHPGASVGEAMAAAHGDQTLSSLVTGEKPVPYRAPSHIKDNARVAAAAAWFKEHSQNHGFFQGLGDVGENVFELLGTGGMGEIAGGADAEKIATFPEKVAEIQKAVTFLAKNPRVAQLVALGIHAAHAAVRSGAEAGAQTYVKTGGDLDAAAKGAMMGAGGSVVLEPILAGASALVRHLTPTVESIAGREVPILRSQVTRTGPGGEPVPPTALQTIAATRDSSPAVAGQQQAAAKAGIEQSAQDVVAREAEATNTTRTAPKNALPSQTEPYTFRIQGTPTAADTEGSIIADPRKRQVGTRVVEGKGSPTGVPTYDASSFTYGEHAPGGEPAGEPLPGSHKEPQFQYLTSSKPGSPPPASDFATGGGELLTQDPEVVAAHLKSLDTIMHGPEFPTMPPEQQAAYQSAKTDLQKQLGEYRMQQKTTQPFTPNFSPLDVKGAVSRTETYGDAASELMKPAKELYDHANMVSGGQWQPLKDRIDELQKQYWSAATDAERQTIGNKLSEANGSMQKILADPANGFDSTDVTTAIRNWRSHYLLNDLHNAIEPAFNIDAQVARETGKYRGFDGNMLANRFKNFMMKNPDARAMLGNDTVNTLQNVFDHNRTMASRKRFGGAVDTVAQWVADNHLKMGGIIGGPAALAGYAMGGYHAAAAAGVGAEALYASTRLVLHKIATDPKVAKNIIYAIDGGARPDNFGPNVGKMVLDSVRRVGVPLAASETARSAN